MYAIVDLIIIDQFGELPSTHLDTYAQLMRTRAWQGLDLWLGLGCQIDSSKF